MKNYNKSIILTTFAALVLLLGACSNENVETKTNQTPSSAVYTLEQTTNDTVVVGHEKFTLPEDVRLAYEIRETQGGRALDFADNNDGAHISQLIEFHVLDNTVDVDHYINHMLEHYSINFTNLKREKGWFRVPSNPTLKIIKFHATDSETNQQVHGYIGVFTTTPVGTPPVVVSALAHENKIKQLSHHLFGSINMTPVTILD